MSGDQFWNIEHDDAMVQARRDDIPVEDAEKMWTKFNELGDAVRAGTTSDEHALKVFGEFCRGLATMRVLLDVMSPDLDVITGKRR